MFFSFCGVPLSSSTANGIRERGGGAGIATADASKKIFVCTFLCVWGFMRQGVKQIFMCVFGKSVGCGEFAMRAQF